MSLCSYFILPCLAQEKITFLLITEQLMQSGRDFLWHSFLLLTQYEHSLLALLTHNFIKMTGPIRSVFFCDRF